MRIFFRNCCCSQWKTTEICVQNASKTWSDFCFKAAFLDPLHFRPTHLPHAAVARSILTTIYLVCWWCFSYVSPWRKNMIESKRIRSNTGSNQTHIGFNEITIEQFHWHASLSSSSNPTLPFWLFLANFNFPEQPFHFSQKIANLMISMISDSLNFQKVPCQIPSNFLPHEIPTDHTSYTPCWKLPTGFLDESLGKKKTPAGDVPKIYCVFQVWILWILFQTRSGIWF